MMSRKEERKFGLLFAALFAVAAFWPLWPPHGPDRYWLAGAGVWLGLALALPVALYPFYRFWMGLGHVLGWINARIILGLVFFFVVTPIGLLLRLSGKDLLNLRRSTATDYWVRREEPFDPQSFRNQF